MAYRPYSPSFFIENKRGSRQSLPFLEFKADVGGWKQQKKKQDHHVSARAASKAQMIGSLELILHGIKMEYYEDEED